MACANVCNYKGGVAYLLVPVEEVWPRCEAVSVREVWLRHISYTEGGVASVLIVSDEGALAT